MVSQCRCMLKNQKDMCRYVQLHKGTVKRYFLCEPTVYLRVVKGPSALQEFHFPIWFLLPKYT